MSSAGGARRGTRPQPVPVGTSLDAFTLHAATRAGALDPAGRESARAAWAAQPKVAPVHGSYELCYLNDNEIDPKGMCGPKMMMCSRPDERCSVASDCCGSDVPLTCIAGFCTTVRGPDGASRSHSHSSEWRRFDALFAYIAAQTRDPAHLTSAMSYAMYDKWPDASMPV